MRRRVFRLGYGLPEAWDRRAVALESAEAPGGTVRGASARSPAFGAEHGPDLTVFA